MNIFCKLEQSKLYREVGIVCISDSSLWTDLMSVLLPVGREKLLTPVSYILLLGIGKSKQNGIYM